MSVDRKQMTLCIGSIRVIDIVEFYGLILGPLGFVCLENAPYVLVVW